MTLDERTAAQVGHLRTMRPHSPRWGDFGGQCLASSCEATTDLLLPGATAMQLPKAGSSLVGTWQTEEGQHVRMLRALESYRTSPILSVFLAHDGGTYEKLEEVNAKLYQGGLRVDVSGQSARIGPPTTAGFEFLYEGDRASWFEDGVLDVSGPLVALPTQWYNPWPVGGAYAVTTKFRARGTFMDRKVDGFFAHESHFFPPGLNFMDSPFGFGGREVHWGHMATAFEDGTVVDASMAIGLDGWAFALVCDDNGNHFTTNDVEVFADVRENGYPERILYRFLGQEWDWQISPHGERPEVMPGGMGPLGAEGIFRRVGETRKVVASMGTIDWWKDGRQKTVPPIPT